MTGFRHTTSSQPPAAPLHIALIASARHPIAEPFAGGLEAHTWTLCTALRSRGHEVTVFAGPGSDPELGVVEMPLRRARISASARRDTSMVATPWLEEHHAYLQLMLELARTPSRYDLVHNNSLNYLPVAMAPALPVPVVTTLHTPPTPWIESAIQMAPHCPVHFSAVSAHAAAAWGHIVPAATVVHNGIDTRRWQPGPGGDDLVGPDRPGEGRTPGDRSRGAVRPRTTDRGTGGRHGVLRGVRPPPARPHHHLRRPPAPTGPVQAGRLLGGSRRDPVLGRTVRTGGGGGSGLRYAGLRVRPGRAAGDHHARLRPPRPARATARRSRRPSSPRSASPGPTPAGTRRPSVPWTS